MKNYRIATLFILGAIITILLLSACSLLESPGASTRTPEEAIAEAVHEYLAQQGGPADQVKVEIEQFEGDYARVKIISTDPDVPGGFTGFLARKDGVWTTLIVGSGFNPMEVQALGIPESILPEGWVFPDEEPAAPTEPASNPSVDSGAPTGCPAPTDGSLLLTDEGRGYCLLYPTSHTVVQLDSGNTEIVVGEVMNHIDPRVSITVEDLAGRTVEQAADEFVTGFEGFDIEQTNLTIAGEEAILLDGIPGQDFYRMVLVTHDGILYRLQFAPFDENLVDTFPQAEQLYTLVMDSFQFSTP